MFVNGKPFQPSLMFVGKAGAYPIEEPFRCCTLGQASGLAHKQETRLERLTRDKHSNLLRNFINHRQKGFIALVSMLKRPFCP